MTERPALRKKIDALYAGPAGEFVAARNALAKELKGEGKADEAKLVSALKKPSVAAAVINRLAHERQTEMKAFAKAAAALRKASGKKLRAAAKAERDAAEALVAAADELMEEEGGGSAATRDRVIETLQAAAADPHLEKLVVAGRLDRERSIASVGFPMGLGGGGEGDGDGDEPDVDEEERKALEKRVHEAKQVLKKAQTAKKRTAKDLQAAEKQLEKAQDADRSAGADLVEAEHELQDREAALNDL